MTHRTVAVAVFALLLSGCAASPASDCTVPELVDRLDSRHTAVRREAAFTLSRLAIDDRKRSQVVEEKARFANHLRNRDLYTCVFVAHTLATLGDDSDELFDVYVRAAKESETWYRVQACCG